MAWLPSRACAVKIHAVLADDVAFWSTTRQVAGIRAGELSARDLLELYAARIEQMNPAINAIVTLDLERASRDASIVDERLARGEHVGPLAGAPMTIKDAIAVGGMRSTAGAEELRDHVPLDDAPAVASLRAAGAVVIGKTNVPRWCNAETETHNELFGTTNNPWDLGRSVGGSSGGSAAAVAAGLSSCDLGTDIGGSVRIPSSYCGTFAWKPSFGAVPQLGYLSHVGAGRVGADMNTFGPITRSADDLALLLDALAGPAPEDALAWRVELPAPRRTRLAEYRVGTWFDEPDLPVARAYRTALERAADTLGAAGAHVVASHPDVRFRDQLQLWMGLAGAAASPSLPDGMQASASGLHMQWIRNHERREELRDRWRSWFDEYDALLCPVVFSAAPLHDLVGDPFARTIDVDGVPRNLMVELPQWTGLVNVVGFPACVVPIGRIDDGLPVGMQIVTSHLRDRECIDLARHVEQVVGGFVPPPL
jgi:amidase